MSVVMSDNSTRSPTFRSVLGRAEKFVEGRGVEAVSRARRLNVRVVDATNGHRGHGRGGTRVCRGTGDCAASGHGQVAGRHDHRRVHDHERLLLYTRIERHADVDRLDEPFRPGGKTGTQRQRDGGDHQVQDDQACRGKRDELEANRLEAAALRAGNDSKNIASSAMAPTPTNTTGGRRETCRDRQETQQHPAGPEAGDPVRADQRVHKPAQSDRYDNTYRPVHGSRCGGRIKATSPGSRPLPEQEQRHAKPSPRRYSRADGAGRRTGPGRARRSLAASRRFARRPG